MKSWFEAWSCCSVEVFTPCFLSEISEAVGDFDDSAITFTGISLGLLKPIGFFK